MTVTRNLRLDLSDGEDGCADDAAPPDHVEWVGQARPGRLSHHGVLQQSIGKPWFDPCMDSVITRAHKNKYDRVVLVLCF